MKPPFLLYHQEILFNVSGNSPCDTYINGLVQERRNSSVLAMELRLFCTNSSIYGMGMLRLILLIWKNVHIKLITDNCKWNMFKAWGYLMHFWLYKFLNVIWNALLPGNLLFGYILHQHHDWHTHFNFVLNHLAKLRSFIFWLAMNAIIISKGYCCYFQLCIWLWYVAESFVRLVQCVWSWWWLPDVVQETIMIVPILAGPK